MESNTTNNSLECTSNKSFFMENLSIRYMFVLCSKFYRCPMHIMFQFKLIEQLIKGKRRIIPVVESRTQGSRPRPRRQKKFEAKDRPSRGQGQGPRTQTQVFSKKRSLKFVFRRKRFSKSFFQAIST